MSPPPPGAPHPSQLFSTRKTNTNLIFRPFIIALFQQVQIDSVPRQYILGSLAFRCGIPDNKTTPCVHSVRSAFPRTEHIANIAASLPPGDGPDRFSPSPIKDGQPRKKSVSNACERCRRRKIRCDGNTPCATCNRFSLPCVRTQKPREVVASSVYPERTRTREIT